MSKAKEGGDASPAVDDDDDDDESADSVRTVSTTVASLWTGNQAHRRLLQKHFLVIGEISFVPVESFWTPN